MLTDLVKVGADVNVCHNKHELERIDRRRLVKGTKMGTITDSPSG